MDTRFNELQRQFIAEMRLLNRPEDRVMTLRLNKLERDLEESSQKLIRPEPPSRSANPPAPRRQSARSRQISKEKRSFAKATSFSRFFARLTTGSSATRGIVTEQN